MHRALVQRKNLPFAAQFESSFEPICTTPVVPAGMSDAVGILWIQDGATYGTSDNRNLSLFLRGMLPVSYTHLDVYKRQPVPLQPATRVND